jgi:hypothetical protein
MLEEGGERNTQWGKKPLTVECLPAQYCRSKLRLMIDVELTTEIPHGYLG